MKQIEPIQIWQNGITRSAVILYAIVVNDNLLDAASMYYSLMDSNKNLLVDGTIPMTGTDYEGYSTNEYAYNFLATTLNIVILGDYVEPTP